MRQVRKKRSILQDNKLLQKREINQNNMVVYRESKKKKLNIYA